MLCGSRLRISPAVARKPHHLPMICDLTDASKLLRSQAAIMSFAGICPSNLFPFFKNFYIYNHLKK